MTRFYAVFELFFIFCIIFFQVFINFLHSLYLLVKVSIFDLHLLPFGRIWMKGLLNIKFSKFSQNFENVGHTARKYAHFEISKLLWGLSFIFFMMLQFDEFSVFQ